MKERGDDEETKSRAPTLGEEIVWVRVQTRRGRSLGLGPVCRGQMRGGRHDSGRRGVLCLPVKLLPFADIGTSALSVLLYFSRVCDAEATMSFQLLPARQLGAGRNCQVHFGRSMKGNKSEEALSELQRGKEHCAVQCGLRGSRSTPGPPSGLACFIQPCMSCPPITCCLPSLAQRESNRGLSLSPCLPGPSDKTDLTGQITIYAPGRHSSPSSPFYY